jgi:hypothetical protein
MKTFFIAMVVVGAGWLTGKAIHNFVDFIIEFSKKQDRENRDD